MDWLKEFEIKVDYTWADLSSSHHYGRILGWGIQGGGRGCLQITRDSTNYYVEIRGSNGGDLIVNNSRSYCSFTLCNEIKG